MTPYKNLLIIIFYIIKLFKTTFKFYNLLKYYYKVNPCKIFQILYNSLSPQFFSHIKICFLLILFPKFKNKTFYNKLNKLIPLLLYAVFRISIGIFPKLQNPPKNCLSFPIFYLHTFQVFLSYPKRQSFFYYISPLIS